MATFLADISPQLIKAAANNAAVTATGDGSEVDMSDAAGPINLILSIGAVTGTSPTLSVTVKSAPNSGGTYAAVPEGTLFSLTSSDANSVKVIVLPQNVNGFLKISWTAGGTTPSFTVAPLFVAQKRITGTGQGSSLVPTTAY